MSYNISVASGNIGATISGAVQVSGSVELLSGSSYAFTLGTIISGGLGINFSGAGVLPVAMMTYDFSGAQWIPWQTQVSGGGSPIIRIGSQNARVENIASVLAPNDSNSDTTNVLFTSAVICGHEEVSSKYVRTTATTSGDGFRLRVSQEGQAPTYSVTATISGVFSGVALNSPIFGLFNYGSGTAIQSGSAYKIKGLYISSDMVGVTSGIAMKFNMIRFTSFSGVGAGVLISGTAMDTRDPAYSGTLAAPALFQNATSGIVYDATYFSYITIDVPTSNIIPTLPLSGSFEGWNVIQSQQLTNLIAIRMPDTKEIIVRSGYGFGVQQASGFGYTQLISGIIGYNINMIYSVEGMSYAA